MQYRGTMAKVTDRERARILAVLEETGNVRETARATGRSRSTVSRIAQEAGVEPAAREQTRAATEARQADNAARRAELAAGFLEDAAHLRKLIHAEHEVTHWTKDGEMVRDTISAPTSADVQRYMTAAAIAVDKSIVLERVDPPAGEGISILERLIAGVRPTSS